MRKVRFAVVLPVVQVFIAAILLVWTDLAIPIVYRYWWRFPRRELYIDACVIATNTVSHGINAPGASVQRIGAVAPVARSSRMGRWRGRCILSSWRCSSGVLGGTACGPPKVPNKNVGFKDVDRAGLVQFAFSLLGNAPLRGVLHVVLRVDSLFRRRHSHFLFQLGHLAPRIRFSMGSYLNNFPWPQSRTLDSEQACRYWGLLLLSMGNSPKYSAS
jgi:hypothetical protein